MMRLQTLFRILLSALSIAGMVYAVAIIANGWSDPVLQAAAQSALRGEAYSSPRLERIVARAQTPRGWASCENRDGSNATILRIRMVEQMAAAQETAEASSLRGRISDVLREQLACDPTDSFAWLALAAMREGPPDASSLASLQMSYDTGANEGWVAARRNWYGLAAFEMLSADYRQLVLKEFVGLLKLSRYENLADAYVAATPDVRGAIDREIRTVDADLQRSFSRHLHAKGITISPAATPDDGGPFRHDGK